MGLLTCAASCTNLDCPLDNVVALTCGLYDADSHGSLTLADTLTVSAGGIKDTVLLNSAQGISSFEVQMRQASLCDTLLLCFTDSLSNSATDTLFVGHSNTVHFESVDCPATVFHRVEDVGWTSHDSSAGHITIDSVAIVRQVVNYENVEHLRIYLRAADN